MLTSKKTIRLFFYILISLMLLWLSSDRTYPVYGKLDFLLVDSKPWWPAWMPMIETALKRGNSQPILSDPVTSTVMKGVFGQRTFYKRINVKGRPLFIKRLDLKNDPFPSLLPTGPLVLLLPDNGKGKRDILDVIADYNTELVTMRNEIKGGYSTTQKFRCIINLHGFRASWVPVETKHWSTRKADTKWFYRYPNTHIVDMKDVLKENPPMNCEVFY